MSLHTQAAYVYGRLVQGDEHSLNALLFPAGQSYSYCVHHISVR
jgi:hypothetical protein